MEFIFFNCKDYQSLDKRIKSLFEKSHPRPIKTASGSSKNYTNYPLNPDKLKDDKNDKGSYDFIDPNEQEPLTELGWATVKSSNGLPRDLPQTRAKLEELGIMPFRYQLKFNNDAQIREGLWEGEEPEDPRCYEQDIYYALILHTTNGKVVGRARAHPIWQHELEQETGIKSQFNGLPKDIKYMYISRVDINPEYRGQKMCEKLVSFIMSKISEAKPDCNHFVIYNASRTANGIPACRCYVKSGNKSGFKVHEEHWETQLPDGSWGEGLNEMTLDKCIGKSKGMPDIYYYVKARRSGGKKKRQTKRKYKKRRRKSKKTKRKC